MSASLDARYRSKGMALLGGTLCATVAVAVAACVAISLLAIGRATEQEGHAIDAAIMAFDLYQQERTPPHNSPDDLVALLNENSALEAVERNPYDSTATTLVANTLAAFEQANAGDVVAAYMVVPEGSGVEVFQSAESLLAPEQREEVFLAMGLDETVSVQQPIQRIVGVGDATFQASAQGTPTGATVVVVYEMPVIPGMEVLLPLHDVAEVYFLDSQGTSYPFGRSDYAAALDYGLLETGTPSGLVSVSHDGTDYRMYFHNVGPQGGIKFVFAVPDLAQASYRQFASAIIVAGIVLVVAGCIVGLVLTRHIYAPIQRVVQRLSPTGRNTQNELKLLGFAFEAMESRLAKQDEVVSEYRLARLLHGQASVADEGGSFFFADPTAEVAVLGVRLDEGAPDADLKRIVAEVLGCTGRPFALCEEGGFVFAAVEEPAAAHNLVEQARQQGTLVSAFASGTHAGPQKLALGYREALQAVESGTRRRVFNGVESFSADACAPRPEVPRADSSAEMIRYVEENFRDQDLSAARIATSFGVSRAAVSRAFAAHCEGGFLGLLHDLRINEAEGLLRDTDLPLAEVASRVGYGTVLTMTRAFKRYRGTTPGAYRAAQRE